MSRKLYKSLKAQKDQTEQVKLALYGSLGIPLNGNKVIQVADRQGYVYVRLRDNQNEVIQAFNNKVAASYGLPVILVREGGRYVVQQFNSQRYLNNAQNSAPFLPGHGTQHSFPRGGGADITWVYGQQIMPGLVYPEAATGTNVMMEKYPLHTNGRWIYTGGTGTQNILQYRPTTGSSSLMALVYLDSITGNPGILVGSGTYFPATITGSVYPYLPSPTNAQIPLAGVLLNTGTTVITWENIYDVRQWVHATPSGTSSGGGGGGVDTIGFVGQNKGVYLATGTILNVNGTRLVMSVSGTSFDLTNSPDPYDNIGIYGLSGTTGLGTGTSISFRNGIISSITGTVLYASVHFGTGTNQVASGDRGVTNGDNHDHVGGDGALLSHSSMVDRVRYVLVPAVYDASAGVAVPAADAHGSLSTEPHWHFADGVTTVIKTTFSIPIPEDYVNGTVNINFLWSTTAASNNVRWSITVREIGTSDTAHTNLLVNTQNVAAPGVANTIAKHTVSLTSNPTAGKFLTLSIIRIGADGGDTNTGQASVWGIYFEYTADM